ncbi:MAG: serine/threonine-protein kinase [Muribaculaceae bacterium]|nr:serine/threonine-protein kinase [Muribaculaceae bacterium]
MIGKEVLNYTIISLIGKGGMGEVYLAEHKFITHQRAAIKVISASMVNDFTLKLLKDEAEHLASLNHPNIVHFIDYHIDESGNVFLIMEYADGMSLDKYVNSVTGLIVEERVLPIIEPILDAVEYAHKHNIIHRDIKPSNIIITKEGVPKILDFGISTFLGSNDNNNIVIGTPSYMSPEQVIGEAVDKRSDIYSIGVLLHQLLTGNAPYDTTTLTEQEISSKIVSEPLPPLKSFYKYTSEKTQKIVNKATAKDKDDRYSSCLEMKKELHNAISPAKIPMWTKIVAGCVAAVLLFVGIYIFDYNRTKTYYYKEYVEQWGVPQGIHELSSREQSHRVNSYRFIYKHHKLQNVAFINSKGSVIAHNNSDDVDDILNNDYYYTPEGKVDYIKVKGTSNQVLYIKDFNPELTVVTFRYDDGRGTEKNLAASTVTAFGSSVGDNSDTDKSRITRYLFTYDENGYVDKIEYASFQNTKVGDKDGLFGRKYLRDDKGRIKEEIYIGFDGNPKAISTGMAIRTREYNDEDDAIRFTYITTDRKASGEEELGVPVCRNVVDEWGNVIEQYYEDLDGNLMLRKDDGFAYAIYTIEDGNTIYYRLFGTDKQRCYGTTTTVSGTKREYDENGFISKNVYIDDKDKPMKDSEGISGFLAVNDKYGNPLSYIKIDEYGKPTTGVAGEYAMCEYKNDERGNCIEYRFFDKKKKLVKIADGYAIMRQEYDSLNRVVKFSHFDADGKPVFDNNNVSVYKREYSIEGNLISMAYFDGSGTKRCLSSGKFAGFTYDYDDNGNMLSCKFYNENWELIRGTSGYAIVKYKYDKNGNDIEHTYYSATNAPCLNSDGEHGEINKYDNRNNVIENYKIGLDGKLLNGRLIARNKYDNADNLIEIRLFDSNNKPVVNSLDYHKVVYKYNQRKNLVRTDYYDTKGELTGYSGYNYSTQKYKYDNRGNLIESSYFAPNGKLTLSQEGLAIMRHEYDKMNRLVRQTYFDASGNPTKPDVMVPEGLIKYDKWGNINYVAAADGKGNLIVPSSLGWCIKRTNYNSRKSIVEEAYYDNHDNPVINKSEGYHKYTAKYDNYNNLKEKKYFGNNGNLMLNESGYAVEKYNYNAHRDVELMAIFDINGNPTDASLGFHKIIIDYDKDSTPTTRKYYNTAGKLIYSQVWDGIEWVMSDKAGTTTTTTTPSTPVADNKNVDIREIVKEGNKNLPVDLSSEGVDMIVKSMAVGANNSIIINFTIEQSSYELSDSQLNIFKECVKVFTKTFKESPELKNAIKVTGILYDGKDRNIFKYTY